MGRPVLYRSSKEFLIRFGLSDLEELPSLKEFEQLARAALGSDEGIAPIEPETLEAADSAESAGATAVEPAQVNEATEAAGENVATAVSEGASLNNAEPPDSAQTAPEHAEDSKAESAS